MLIYIVLAYLLYVFVRIFLRAGRVSPKILVILLIHVIVESCLLIAGLILVLGALGSSGLRSEVQIFFIIFGTLFLIAGSYVGWHAHKISKNVKPRT